MKAPDENAWTRVNLSIDERTKAIAQDMAARRAKSFSQLVRDLVREEAKREVES